MSARFLRSAIFARPARFFALLFFVCLFSSFILIHFLVVSMSAQRNAEFWVEAQNFYSFSNQLNVVFFLFNFQRVVKTKAKKKTSRERNATFDLFLERYVANFYTNWRACTKTRNTEPKPPKPLKHRNETTGTTEKAIKRHQNKCFF